MVRMSFSVRIAERMIRRDRTIVNKKKGDGFTPLHMCACNNHAQIMKTLLEEVASVCVCVCVCVCVLSLIHI